MKQTLAFVGLGLPCCWFLEGCSVAGVVMPVQTLLRPVQPLPAQAQVVEMIPVGLGHPVQELGAVSLELELVQLGGRRHGDALGPGQDRVGGAGAEGAIATQSCTIFSDKIADLDPGHIYAGLILTKFPETLTDSIFDFLDF